MAPTPPNDAPETGPGPEAAGREPRILVALTGGIACYKTATLVSRLSQRGCFVRVVMTDAATKFITPLTLQALSGAPVLTSIWQHDEHPDSQHIGLARWCDLLVIAPATADIMGRIASGLSGDLVSLVAAALPRETPVLIAPAMNAQMWENPVTQRNLATLRDLLGWRTVGPETGWQACRTRGAGRMSEPETILDAVMQQLER
ncbi:MAG: flavoprotein [Phycisphaeraceae bacterium]